jgi:hypothetical protein
MKEKNKQTLVENSEWLGEIDTMECSTMGNFIQRQDRSNYGWQDGLMDNRNT